MDVLPLFKSHYSLGKSILTLDKPKKEPDDFSPDSIFDLALATNLSHVVLVDDNMSGYLEGYLNARAAKIPLIFGVRLTFTADASIRSEESLQSNHKVIIFEKTEAGHSKLVELYTDASTNYSYYEPRYDFQLLKKLWDDKDLMLCIPFYDSFLFKNSLKYGACVPDFSFASPTFFLEDNQLPFDNLIRNRVMDFASDRYPILKTKSIYYRNRKDFKSYLTFRCINNRTTLNKPELEHCSSEEFCLESLLRQ